MKEKLIKLLSSAKFGANNITLLDKHDEKAIEEIADYLLKNGVVVQMTIEEVMKIWGIHGKVETHENNENDND